MAYQHGLLERGQPQLADRRGVSDPLCVRCERVNERGLPLLVMPDSAQQQRPVGVDDLTRWLAGRRTWVQDQLAATGGILFRNLGVRSAQAMEACTQALGFELMDYLRGNTRRSVVHNQIQTSTDAPFFAPIAQHNEMSYAETFPRRIAFCCQKVAGLGGCTPLTDMQRVCERIPAPILSRFQRYGIVYIDNLPRANQMFRPGWSQMFQASTREQAERVCAEMQLEWQWHGDHLRLTSRRPAVRLHSGSGKPIWFNQVHIWHPSYSAELLHQRNPLFAFGLRCVELSRCWFWPAERLAKNVFYGDGQAISAHDVYQIRKAIWSETFRFRWQAGDMLVLDNERIAHGRDAFLGPRKLYAALVK